MKRNLLVTLSLLLICPLALLAQSPWQQHGKLEASKNGHTIQHKDGTPFLWIGDTGWGMFQQLTREEVDYYLVYHTLFTWSNGAIEGLTPSQTRIKQPSLFSI